jgi:hypothetical protein
MLKGRTTYFNADYVITVQFLDSHGFTGITTKKAKINSK